MDVRHPSAIFVVRTHASKLLALCNALPDVKIAERVTAEVSVKCKEFLTITGGVLQDYDWPVVQWR